MFISNDFFIFKFFAFFSGNKIRLDIYRVIQDNKRTRGRWRGLANFSRIRVSEQETRILLKLRFQAFSQKYFSAAKCKKILAKTPAR